MRIVCIVCATFILCCVSYAYQISQAESIVFAGKVYFLVSNDTRIEASAEFVKWDGGAGYLLEHEGSQYVAYTVFLDEKEGRSVQSKLTTKGKASSLLQTGSKTLYFKGKEKAKAKVYVNALNLLKSYIRLLSDCIGMLDNGMTQEASKRVLTILAKQLYCAKNNYSGYAAFAALCEKAEGDVLKICQGEVYLKDLRFLLCGLAEKYTKLCAAFSL